MEFFLPLFAGNLIIVLLFSEEKKENFMLSLIVFLIFLGFFEKIGGKINFPFNFFTELILASICLYLSYRTLSQLENLIFSDDENEIIFFLKVILVVFWGFFTLMCGAAMIQILMLQLFAH